MSEHVYCCIGGVNFSEECGSETIPLLLRIGGKWDAVLFVFIVCVLPQTIGRAYAWQYALGWVSDIHLFDCCGKGR